MIGHALWLLLLLLPEHIGRPDAHSCQAVVVVTVMVDVLATVVVNTVVALMVAAAAAATYSIVDVASVIHQSGVVQLRRNNPVRFLFSGHR